MKDDEIARAWDAAIARSVDVRAEQSVLGGCLHKPGILDWLDLAADAFWDARHAQIWQSMQRLVRAREPVDEVTIAADLERGGRLAMVGGSSYLGELSLRVPTVDNVAAYAEILGDLLKKRQIIRLAASIPSRVAEGLDGEQLLDQVHLSLAELEPVRAEAGGSLAELVRREAIAAVEFHERAAKHGEAVGVPTGIPHLDERIGGMPIGVPTVLGARAGNGKSSMAISIALRAARAGIGVHLVTYEDFGPVFAQRALAQETGIEVNRIAARRFERQDVSVLMSGAEMLQPVTRMVIDHGHGLPVDRLVRMARARKREIGTRLFILDYLQLVPPMAHERRWQRHEQIRSAMVELATLAGQEGIAALVCSQLNREAEADARRPRLDDFRGSGAIEEVGKLIMALHPGKLESEIEVLILKNSQGPTATLIAKWDRPRCWIG